MSFLRDIDGSGRGGRDPLSQIPGAHEEDRRTSHSTLLGLGTLACNRCDAPVAPAGRALSPADAIECPYCRQRATVREFLSLEPPTRPARVAIHVRRPAVPRG
jgi:hypothetical protein